MLTFGVTVLPDPPYTRLIELNVLAEQHGFEYGWTYDSHILWQESYATLPLVADRTDKIKLGHFVTNPGIRDPTITASWYATMHDLSNGRMVMGIGRGDSSRRVVGLKPVKVAEFEAATAMIKDLMNGRPVVWNEKELKLEWVRPELPDIEVWVAGYGPKALAVAGRVGDGVIIQLADPQIIQWIMDTARASAVEAGRDPSALKCIVGAPSMIGDDIADAARAGALVPGDGLEPRDGPDRALRVRLGDSRRADRVRQDAQRLRLQGPQPRRRGARRVRHRRDLRPLLRARQHRAGDRRSCASSSRSASTSSTST